MIYTEYLSSTQGYQCKVFAILSTEDPSDIAIVQQDGDGFCKYADMGGRVMHESGACGRIYELPGFHYWSPSAKDAGRAKNGGEIARFMQVLEDARRPLSRLAKEKSFHE